jgi:hypothetical protein
MYVHTRCVNVQGMLAVLLLQKPDDPLEFLTTYLQRLSSSTSGAGLSVSEAETLFRMLTPQDPEGGGTVTGQQLLQARPIIMGSGYPLNSNQKLYVRLCADLAVTWTSSSRSTDLAQPSFDLHCGAHGFLQAVQSLGNLFPGLPAVDIPPDVRLTKEVRCH